MNKYDTLLNILDKLKNEAPSNYKRYYPKDDDIDGLNDARSRAFIHLFLKVKFGILNFIDRENYITDGTDDGGVDGYYIDKENKKIYFIQSKFRTSKENFESKNIEIEEIIKMELDRITKGETKSINGRDYNGKIQQLIHAIDQIDDYPKYKEQVILLANLKEKYHERIKPITLFPTHIYDYEKCYNNLVFPVVSGTFFNPKELKISININADSASSRIDYYVDTSISECNINALFVPTIEVAKILYRYKNSVLLFNPRSYLELASGSVNKKIQDSIVTISTNEFALYNNGITMLSDNTYYSDRIGRKSEAELIVTNPQIINGGQTAFTLSRIYEDCIQHDKPLDIFEGKEVLLKVITFSENESDLDEDNKLHLIEAISKATNNQTAVTEADRRSNEKVQVDLQRRIYEDFGYFYERKRGEFSDGIKNKYINRAKIIDRELFLRVCTSTNGNAGQARRASSKILFSKMSFDSIFPTIDSYKKHFFAYKSLETLNDIQRKYDKEPNNRFGVAQYGNGIRYGKLAIAGVVGRLYDTNLVDINIEDIASVKTNMVLAKWLEFEEYVMGQPDNKRYFKTIIDPESREKTVELNFNNYYKGRTIGNDLHVFFNSAFDQSEITI